MRFANLTAAACLLCTASALADTAAPPRETLLAKPVTLPSASVTAKVIRVKFPPGYKTPLHTHEGQGPRYVLRGKITVEDHGKSFTYKAGETFWETGEEMTAANAGTEDAEMLIFELAPVGK
jgi:quercetin dioxygenase-like cupin family protein